MEDRLHLGAKALICNEEGALLVLLANASRRATPVVPYWDSPGGRVQKGESVIDALKREVKEELGVGLFSSITPFLMTLSPVRIPDGQESVGLIFSFFRCVLLSPYAITLSGEHTSFEWVSPAEAANRLQAQYTSVFTENLLKKECYS